MIMNYWWLFIVMFVAVAKCQTVKGVRAFTQPTVCHFMCVIRNWNYKHCHDCQSKLAKSYVSLSWLSFWVGCLICHMHFHSLAFTFSQTKHNITLLLFCCCFSRYNKRHFYLFFWSYNKCKCGQKQWFGKIWSAIHYSLFLVLQVSK